MNKIQHTIYIKRILKIKNIQITEENIEDCIDWAQWANLKGVDINHPSTEELCILADEYYNCRGKYIKGKR